MNINYCALLFTAVLIWAAVKSFQWLKVQCFLVKAKRWRRQAKVGDSCWYVNIMGGISVVEIVHIEGDNCLCKGGIRNLGTFSGWHNIDNLFPV